MTGAALEVGSTLRWRTAGAIVYVTEVVMTA
jgi:hypothetical protein